MLGRAVQEVGAHRQHRKQRRVGGGGRSEEQVDELAALLGRRECPQLLALVDDKDQALASGAVEQRVGE